MADIFISYNQQDREMVRLTAAYLEGQGYSVWWDTELLSGDDYQLQIMEKLQAARAVIVIWSQNAIQSTWVRAEAGAAQADQKLIPLKAATVAYDDIPPPFNMLHADDVSNREAVLAAVQRQMAKPAPAPVLIRQARYEMWSWVGVIGATVTLFANMKGAFQLAKYIHLLVEGWANAVKVFWQTVLFFLPPINASDALLLTFVTFSFITIFSAARATHVQKLERAGQKIGLATLMITIVFVYGFFVAGALSESIFVIALKEVFRISSTLDPYLEQVYGSELSEAILMIALFIVFSVMLIAFPMWLLRLISESLLTRNMTSKFSVVLVGSCFGLVCVLLLFAHFIVFGALMYFFMVIGAFLYAMAIGAGLSLLFTKITGRKISLAAVNTRLWRILTGFVLLLVVNFGFVWVETQPWAQELLG